MRTLEDLLEEASSHVALALAVSPNMLLKPASSLVFLSPSQIDVLDQTLLVQAGALTEARLRQSRLQGEHGTGATWRRLEAMWAALEAVPEPRLDLDSEDSAVVELGKAIDAAVERALGGTHEPPPTSLNLSIDMLLWPTEELARLAPGQVMALIRLVEAQRGVLQATRVSQARHQERAAAGDEQIRKTEIAKLKVEQALAQSLESEPGRM